MKAILTKSEKERLLEQFEKSGGLVTLKDAPRILPMGKFLRKAKINELPQLINIFIGNMSVIGYRAFVKKALRFVF